MAVLPLEDGPQVRRLELDATDPLPVVVRWCRRALLEAAPADCLRLVVFKNWDDDERQIFDIPEARAYCRRLWLEARPLLRLLSESTWAALPDDRHGLPGEVLSALGLGWFDVWLAGFGEVLEQEQMPGDYGPVYRLEMIGLSKRAELRAELLETSDENLGGLSWDAVSERSRLMRAHRPALAQQAGELHARGLADWVLIVVSLLDEIGRELMARLYGPAAVREHLERCRRDGLNPAAVVAAPRDDTAKVLAVFAPAAAGTLAEPAGEGEYWVVTIAGGGTQVGRFSIAEEETS
jgi:hypothetical protein